MADTDNLNIISSSKYDIYTKLLDLLAAGEYATPQDNFEKVDFLKAGLFGYVTEATAMSIRDSAFHKTMVYRESFLNTAIIPSSVYNYAKMFNIEVVDATPASRYAIISISTDDIANGISQSKANAAAYQTKYGISDSSNFIIIDKSNPIIAGNTYYSLEHSIEIHKGSNGKYTVRYCVGEQDETTSFGDYSAYPISSYVSGDALHFTVKVYQYKTVHSYSVISGSTFMDVKTHSFTYPEDQLCGMKLSYTKGSTTENVTLNFSNMTSASSDSTEKIATYSLGDDNTINIDFATNISAGLPQPGGRLDLEMFLTKGAAGNTMYSGTAIMTLAQDDFKTIAVGVVLDQDYLTGGTDQSSLQQIKTRIIRQLSSRNTIVTESDMNTWFAAQSDILAGLSHSNITFRKEVDDFMKRTYSAEVVLRDGVALSEYLGKTTGTVEVDSSYISSVVPTNTIDVVYQLNANDDSGDTIKLTPNVYIEYDSALGVYKYGVNGSTSKYSYQTPFNIVVNKKYGSVSYFYLETDSTSSLTASINSIADDFSLTPNAVEVVRTNTSNGKYEFRFSVASENDLTKMNIDGASITIDSAHLPLTNDTLSFTKVESDDSDDESISEYMLTIALNGDLVTDAAVPKVNLKEQYSTTSIDANASVNVKLQLILKSDSAIKFDGTLSGTDSIQLFRSLDDVMSSDVEIGTALPAGICKIYYDANTKNVKGLAFVDGSSAYIANNEYSDGTTTYAISFDPSAKKLTIGGNNYDNVVAFDATAGEISTTVTQYVIKAVPVIASYWIDDKMNKTWMIKQLTTYMTLLQENADKLETSTFFNLKFRNTYGISKRCSSVSTQLRMMLTVYLNEDAIVNNAGSIVSTTDADAKDSIQNEIRDFIRVQVDSANDSGELVVSKIIMATQAAYYQYINHIDFNGINGTFTQYIKKNDDTSVASPLEWFSLDETKTNNESNIEKDIAFEYV